MNFPLFQCEIVQINQNRQETISFPRKSLLCLFFFFFSRGMENNPKKYENMFRYLKIIMKLVVNLSTQDGQMKIQTHLYEEGNSDEYGKDKHATETIEMQRSPSRSVHQWNRN